MKPEVGQTLYSLNVGNTARGREQKLTEVVVLKVGRKYFTCAEKGREEWTYLHTTYHLSNWREKSNYAASSQLYSSPDKWEEEKEAKELYSKISNAFKYGINTSNLGVNALRGIWRIIEANGDNQ